MKQKLLRRIAPTAAMVAALYAGSCELPPASPSPVGPDRPEVTMTVLPGTVSVLPGSIANFYYSACFQLRNPATGAVAKLVKMEFTPMADDGTTYPTQATVGGFSVPAGGDYSGCWGFQEFRQTHPAPTRYRLRFTYYFSDAVATLTAEGTSTLSNTGATF